jgi:hypothetical protein
MAMRQIGGFAARKDDTFLILMQFFGKSLLDGCLIAVCPHAGEPT